MGLQTHTTFDIGKQILLSDSLCKDDTDVLLFKSLQTFKCLDSKVSLIAYCVSGVVFYP